MRGTLPYFPLSRKPFYTGRMKQGVESAAAQQDPTPEAHGKQLLDTLVALGVLASPDAPYKVSGGGTSLAITGTPDGMSETKTYRGRVRNVMASPGFLRQGALMVATEEDGIKYFNFSKISSIEKAQ